tara:strand:+ start:214632 stop:215012 length:381 start_codon:yes stop_codon:yes gene_type:complete
MGWGSKFKFNSKKVRCDETDKHRYNSEAQAIRAMNKHSDLKRTYYCSHCDGFHNTSMTLDNILERSELSLEEENTLLKQKVDRLVKREDTMREKLGRQKLALAQTNRKIIEMKVGMASGISTIKIN